MVRLLNKGQDYPYACYRKDFHLINSLAPFIKAMTKVDVFNPGDRLVSRRTDFPWPPYSPDLNPPDYFLWGYLKEKVYASNPQILAVLKENIRREIWNIPGDMTISMSMTQM
jgi:hypothetical protein